MSAAGGSARAFSGSPSEKSCSLTEMMSAKSVPTSSSRSKLNADEALVAHAQLVLHPVAHEALARDREHVLVETAGERVAEEERGRVVLDLPRREQERPLSVDAQLEPREEARVLGEEAARRAVEVADLVAEAERRAFQNRQHVAHSRWILAPLDCASALITISSRFTWSGRVSANITHSAMSSAVSAPPNGTLS